MKKTNKFLSLVPLLLLWAVFCALIWGFVFARLTYTDPAHKLVLYVDAPVADPTALAVALEEGKGPGIRMVQARPFTYAMLNSASLRSADLYIIPASEVDLYADWLTPLPGELAVTENALIREGAAWGIPLAGAAASHIEYDGSETYYLFFGRESLHVPGNPEAVDGEALPAACRLLALP